MSQTDNRLEDLLVDEKQLDQEALFDILHEYVRIGSDTGRLIFEEAYEGLKAKKRILIVVMAQTARKELGKGDKADTPWLSPSEISELGGIKKGTVDPAVRDLYAEGLLENEEGKYRVSRNRLHRILALFDENG